MEATGLLAWLKVVAIMMIMIVMIMIMMQRFVILCTASIPWRLLDYLLG